MAGSAESNNTQENPRRASTNQASGNPVKNYVLSELAKLMTTCVVLRIQDFTLYKITTTKKQIPKELVSGLYFLSINPKYQSLKF